MRLHSLVPFQKRNTMVKFVFAITFLTLGCANKEKVTNASSPQPPQIPAEVTNVIQKEFPGAMPYGVAIDTLLKQLARVGITSDKILWGQSTCVDDIINTKDKLTHAEIKGPFTFGGLGGLPFTGVTGLDAFAHHVPEDGTALLFVGPHIGYTEGEGWGKILRHGQHHPSSCCGALYSALDKLAKNEITTGLPSEDDYQEQLIEQLALRHQQEILSAPEPLVMLTRVVFQEADHKITEYAKRVTERHFAYAAVVVGVIINTDHQYDDYLWIDHVVIKDIKQNRWIESPIQNQ